MNITALVFDYGGVLAWPPSTESCTRLAREAGIPHDVLVDRYFDQRAAYDLDSISDHDYWRSIVSGFPAAADDARLAKLAELDVEAWIDPNPATVGWLPVLDEAGYTLALLSNMPRTFWRRLPAHAPWLDHFDHAVISGLLRLSKPEPPIFHRLLELLDRPASELLFLDDTAANVAAARALGLHAEAYNVFDGGLAAIAERYGLPVPHEPAPDPSRHTDTACAPHLR